MAAAARVARLPKITDKAGFWVARRCGYTRDTNPNNLFILMSSTGAMGAPVHTKRLEPTAREPAEAFANVAERHRAAPVFFAVDCVEAIPELKTAFGSHHEAPTTGGRVMVDYYPPPSDEELRQINDIPR